MCKIKGLFKDFPTIFKVLKFMKNTDLNFKFLLQTHYNKDVNFRK